MNDKEEPKREEELTFGLCMICWRHGKIILQTKEYGRHICKDCYEDDKRWTV